MAINTDFYGSNYYTLPSYNNGIKTANFTGATTPDITASTLQYAINSGRYTAGTLVDSSASTHGIPGTLSGHTYNTMFDYAAVNCRLTNADCVRDRHSGGSLPIMWRCRYRSSGNANTSIMYNVYNNEYNNNVLNAPGRDGTWDLYRYNAIVSADFKKFAMCIVVIAFDGTITDNGDGTYTGSVTRFQNMDLNCYLSPTRRYDNGTKTAREYYPYISQIYLVPASGSSFNNFDSIISVDQSLGCIPNTLYNFACSKVVDGTPTDDNTPNAVINNAVSYMDGVPNSGGSIRYIYYAGDTEMTDTLSWSSGVYSHFCIFGMIGGNGTSTGVETWTPSGDNLQGYLHGVRGFTHCRIVRTDAEGGVYRGFSYWYDMPQTAEDIKDAVLKMCSYMGCMISTSVESMLNDFDRSPRYIGVLDDNGIATGTYEEITAETLADFVQTATDDFIDNTPYDPTYKPDDPYADAAQSQIPLDKTDVWNWTTNSQLVGYAYALSTNVYLCSPDMIGTIRYKISQLPSASSKTSTFPYFNAEKWANICGTSVFDSVLSVKCIPIRGLDQIVAVGNEITSKTLIPDVAGISDISIYKPLMTTATMDMGSIDLKITQGWELEYTNFEIFLPYAGSHPIQIDSPSALHLYCNVDIITGDLQYYLVQDGNVIFSAGGNCGIDLPFNLAQAQMHYNKQAYKQNLISSGLATAGKVVGAAMTGGIGGTLLGGAIDTVKDQLTLRPHNVQSCPAIGAGCAAGGPCVAYVLAKVPVMHERAFGYNQAIGSDKKHLATSIGSESGYVLTENYKATSIVCTEDEKREIERLMDSGVFI